MKKLLATILALVMAVGLCSVSWAEENKPVYPDNVTTESFGENNVYYVKADGAGEYAVDVKTATDAGAVRIYCKANANMKVRQTDTNRTEPLKGSVTIYGNGANFNGGQINIQPDASVSDTLSLVIENANNLSVWGNPGKDNKTYNVTLKNCTVKKDSGEGILMYRGGADGTTVLNLIVDQCTVEAEGTTAMDGIHTTVAGSIKVTNSKFIKNANAINVAMKVPGTMQITVEKCTFEECGLVTTGEGDYRAPIRVVKTGAGTLTATINESTFKDTVGTNGDILVGDGRYDSQTNASKESLPVEVTVTKSNANVQVQEKGYMSSDGTKNDDKVSTTPVKESQTLTVKPATDSKSTVKVEDNATSTGGYYYYHPTTDTKTDTTKGSPKTFDAGIGIYAVTAVLSVTGMAWTAKKRH